MAKRELAAKLCAMIMALSTPVGTSLASELVLSTSDNRIYPSAANQGWWSDNHSNPSSDNVSWLLGTNDNNRYRNFATFFIPDFNGQVTSAVLASTRTAHEGTNEPTETVGFFDVTTSAPVLNANVGTSSAIYNDLGSGTSYGEFTIPGPNETGTLHFMLNANALAAINQTAPGYFSIGGRLLSDDGNDVVTFGAPGNVFVTLTLTIVPEPATFGAASLALVAITGLRYRRTASCRFGNGSEVARNRQPGRP